MHSCCRPSRTTKQLPEIWQRKFGEETCASFAPLSSAQRGTREASVQMALQLQQRLPFLDKPRQKMDLVAVALSLRWILNLPARINSAHINLASGASSVSCVEQGPWHWCGSGAGSSSVRLRARRSSYWERQHVLMARGTGGGAPSAAVVLLVSSPVLAWSSEAVYGARSGWGQVLRWELGRNKERRTLSVSHQFVGPSCISNTFYETSPPSQNVTFSGTEGASNNCSLESNRFIIAAEVWWLAGETNSIGHLVIYNIDGVYFGWWLKFSHFKWS